MKSRQSNVTDAQRQARADKLLGPGFFFFPPKTSLSIVSYRKAETFSVEQTLEYLQRWSTAQPDLKISVQLKYDGISCYLHRTADEDFFVFTDDGTDVTDRVPHLIEKAKEQLPKTDYIVLGEIEKWITQGNKRVHQGREYVAGEIHAAGPPKDRAYVWNVYDLLWFNGKDLHNLEYQQRFETLQKEFHFDQSLLTSMQPGFNLAPNSICETDEEIRKALKAMVAFEFSEGAMVKKWNGFKFELDGRTNDVLKFKKYAEAHLWVVDKRTISGAEKTFQYKVAIEVLPSEMEDVDESAVISFRRRKAMIVAKTFNTNVVANVGDILTVQFHNVFATRTESGKIKLTLYEPKVYENRTLRGVSEDPDTVTTLIKIGRDAQLFRYKHHDDEFLPFELVKQVGIFQQYPAEGRMYPFIIHNHWRGKSVHADLRLSHVNRQYLIGYTLDVQVPDIVRDPVLNMDRAREMTKKDELWKFNAFDGTFKSRQTRVGMKKATSVLVQLKAPEPNEWLSFEGVSERGSVGSTRDYPGVFLIVAKGNVEYGFRSGYFHEYWFHCEQWPNGGMRLLFRELASDITASIPVSKFLQWAFDVDNPITDFQYGDHSIVCDLGEVLLPEQLQLDFGDSLSLALAPAEKPELRTPTMWMLIKPNTDEPYVLSQRAATKGRMPPFGISALPKTIKDQIPAEFAYWTIKESKKALEVRNSLIAAIKKKKVKLDFTVFKSFKSTGEEQAIETSVEVEREFILNRRTWRGPIVVRLGYSGELYDLWIATGEGATLFTFSDDPREATEITGTAEKFSDKILMAAVGELLPGSRLNPNKRIPVKVVRLEKGKLLLFVDDPNLKKFQVKSKNWQGVYLLEQDEDSKIWTLRVAEAAIQPVDSQGVGR